MQRKIALSWMILVVVVALGVLAPAETAPFPHEKRGFGLDFGLNRGYSGSQAAKHMMGMAAANYAGGPGRRRRSEHA